MRLLRNLLLTLLVIAATAAATVGALATWPTRLMFSTAARGIGNDILAELNRQLVAVPDWTFLFWLVILITCLLVFFLWLFSLPKKLRIERRVEGGNVLMSPHATKRYIATALTPFSDLICRKIELKPGRKGLEAVVHADLRTQNDVASLERQLIERVHSALTEDLGIENVSKVSVLIKQFGLPKGFHPNPVPAVMLPERDAEDLDPREPVEPVPPVSPVAVVAPVPDAVSSQTIMSVSPAVSEQAARPALNEKGNLLFSDPAPAVPPSETLKALHPLEPVEPIEASPVLKEVETDEKRPPYDGGSIPG